MRKRKDVSELTTEELESMLGGNSMWYSDNPKSICTASLCRTCKLCKEFSSSMDLCIAVENEITKRRASKREIASLRIDVEDLHMQNKRIKLEMELLQDAVSNMLPHTKAPYKIGDIIVADDGDVIIGEVCKIEVIEGEVVYFTGNRSLHSHVMRHATKEEIDVYKGRDK